MSPPNAERRLWALRARLLAPVVGLVLAAAVGIGIVDHLAADRQLEALASRRGAAVSERIANRLRERQQAEEIVAQLLADSNGLATTLEEADQVGLAQLLVPLKAKLGLGEIHVYTGDRRELLHLGVGEHELQAPLVAAALSGVAQSTTRVTGSGLLMSGTAPIKGPRGIVGVIVVGTTLRLDALKERDTVGLGLVRDGSLIATTGGMPELAALLGQSAFTPEGLAELNRSLARLSAHATASPLADDDLLLALVSIEDLVEATQEEQLLKTVGTASLLGALLLVGLLLAREIADPLRGMLTATEHIARGNYGRRVAPSRIRELNDLAGAVNHLAEQMETQIAELAHHAFHDPLSGLPNRLLLLDRLERALAREDRGARPVAVLFLDLDNFKVVNDSLGHHVGDRLLVAVAERLRACLRPTDTVARLGGDEFTILLEEITDAVGAIRVAKRIQVRLRAPFTLEGHEVFTTASIGIAFGQAGHERPEDLLRDADLAMYAAKTNGKAQYRVFDRSLSERAMQRLELEADLRRAVERGELRVLYQPIVDLETGRMSEVEALVRWEHPRRGLLSPAEFIPVAEETGLIVPIGRWVLREASRQAVAWQAEYRGTPPLVVGVNLSARQFQQPYLVGEISRVLRQTGLDPGRLKLEIIESVAMKDAESAAATLRELKAVGIQLAIDDFGTGYSSLSYLKRFPIDTLKIDRSFVDGLGQRNEDEAIVRAVIALARALNLSVTAEGIETAEQLATLRALGCDRGQGYYLARPLASDALGALLASPDRALARTGADLSGNVAALDRPTI